MRQYLIEHAARMNIEMTSAQADAFVLYHKMLTEANREMNLTRVPDDIPEACDRNYLDSLTVLPYLRDAERVIDVGSGAGFPGIPLAIMQPQTRFVLLDTLQKRVCFLQEVIDALRLNAEAVHMRCEDAAKRPEYRDAFDAATARAVAETNVLAEWLLPFVKVGGKMLALKGAKSEEELQNAYPAIEALGGRFTALHEAPVPDRDWQHTILEIEKLLPTPARFPRKSGIAEKRPLK